MATQLRIPFHGETILCFEDEAGEPFVAVKPICERLGVDWKSQYRKIIDPKNDWGIRKMTIPSTGGEQETICLALFDFFLWLATIHPSKVAEALQVKVQLYRRECKQVLWSHFMQKQWQLEDQMTRARGFMLAHNARWAKIANLQIAKVNRVMVYHHINLSFTKTMAIIEEMEGCGAICKQDWHEELQPSPARLMSGTGRRNAPPLITDRELMARNRAARTGDSTPLEAILEGKADDTEVH